MHLGIYVRPLLICFRYLDSVHRVPFESTEPLDDPAHKSSQSSVLQLQQNASRKRPAPDTRVSISKITRIQQAAVGLIIDANLPFNIMKNPYMQLIFRIIDPDIADSLALGRTKMRNLLDQQLDQLKPQVMHELSSALSSIHISFDLWTSPIRLAFIAVFAHFFNSKDKYVSRLIAFQHIDEKHHGRNLASTIEGIISSWGFASRLGVVVADNASNNDTCLQALYPQIIPGIRASDIRARRMRCFGHIINLVAGAFLFGDEADAFELHGDHLEQLQRHEDALQHWRKRGPVAKLRNIVKFIRSSPQRTAAFNAASRQSEDAPDNDVLLFVSPTSHLELVQNNATRWNSTYLMIKRAML